MGQAVGGTPNKSWWQLGVDYVGSWAPAGPATPQTPTQPSDQPQPPPEEAFAQPFEPQPHVPSLLERWVQPDPSRSYNEEVTGAAERISELVDGFFAFVATDSIDLSGLYRAAHALVAEFTRLIHQIFPFMPAMTRPQPAQPPVWVEPPRRPPAPLRPLPEKEQERVKHYANLVQKALYGERPQLDIWDLQFCELSARLGLGLGRQLREGADLRYSYQSEEAKRRLDEIIVELASGLRKRIEKAGLNRFKTALLEKLQPYLAEALGAITALDEKSGSTGSTPLEDVKRRPEDVERRPEDVRRQPDDVRRRPEDVKRQRGIEQQEVILDYLHSKNLAASPYQCRANAYRDRIHSHFNDELKKHLGHLTSNIPELNIMTLDPLCDKLSQQLTDVVYGTTTEEAVNGYFWTVMESLEGRSQSDSKAIQMQGRTLDTGEKELIMGMLHTALRELCGSGYATETIVNWFKDSILIKVDESLQQVITPNESGTEIKPQMSFVNAILESQVRDLESSLGEAPLTEEQLKQLERFYDPKNVPEMGGVWTGRVLKYSGVHKGICRLRDILLYQPEIARNMMVLMIDDFIEKTWPLETNQ